MCYITTNDVMEEERASDKGLCLLVVLETVAEVIGGNEGVSGGGEGDAGPAAGRRGGAGVRVGGV